MTRLDLVLHFLFGGSLIGLGMIVCGSCPGTVFVQVLVTVLKNHHDLLVLPYF